MRHHHWLGKVDNPAGFRLEIFLIKLKIELTYG